MIHSFLGIMIYMNTSSEKYNYFVVCFDDVYKKQIN